MPKIDVLLHGYNFRADAGIIGFCSIVLVTGQKRTLVDVGHVGRRTALEAALQQRGLTPRDIDVVVMSHAHWDHNQNFDVFEHAPLITHPWERKYAQKPAKLDWATPQWTGAMLECHPNIVEVEDGYEIEPGVTVMHTPGHSPGSISVLVETEEYGTAAMTGDVLHFAGVAKTRKNPLVFWSDEDATKSIDRILATADSIFPGHDQPFRMANGEPEYIMPLKITLGGIQPDNPGLAWENNPRVQWIMPGIEEQRKNLLG